MPLPQLRPETARAPHALHAGAAAWRGLPAALVVAALLGLPGAATAQLRPLDPLDWSALDDGWRVAISAGGSLLDTQRSSLAGAEGRLYELGIMEGSWRVGGPVIHATVVARRVLRVEGTYASPVPGVGEVDDRLEDVGEVRISTIVPLYVDETVRSALRFGTRLPVSDSESGLGRDRTDFFALVGGRVVYRWLMGTAEAGVGIHGVSSGGDYEQVDVLLYAAGVEGRFGWLRPSLTLAGQVDGLRGHEVRGNEDLQELRLGLRAGHGAWVQVDLIRGFRRFSPGTGIRVRFGGRW